VCDTIRAATLWYWIWWEKQISEIWQNGADEIGSRRALAVVAKAMALGTKQEGEEEECMQQQQWSVRS